MLTDAGIAEPDDVDFDDTKCHVCASDDNAHQLLLCDGDGCDRGYHSYCLRPPLSDIFLAGVRTSVNCGYLHGYLLKLCFCTGFSEKISLVTQDEQWFCPKCTKVSKYTDEHASVMDRARPETTHPMCTTTHHRCRFAQFVIGKQMPRCLFLESNHKMCLSCQRRFRKIRRDDRQVSAGFSYEISDLTEHELLHEEHLPLSQVQEIMALLRPEHAQSQSSGVLTLDMYFILCV
jgi:hypothetical protein